MLTRQLRPDVRRLAESEDRASSCRRCGVRIYVLPEDRRRGFCYDCYDPSEVRATVL